MKKIIALIIALVSLPALAGQWVQVPGWTVKVKVNPVALENMLWEYIHKESRLVFQPRESYTYQYKAITDTEILINALCEVKDKELLEKKFIQVFDGGSCYFQAKYNFELKKVTNLVVNGEA
ncbi:MAG: hypothetical protein KZQ93_04380 [Candidatus Thiodiazotropha sp. (ex Monitilora ramsayi)]|nr:hypothetical protein [Candidatus Thiodiazotropha sp. (ex Monitilora ramsayi)]